MSERKREPASAATTQRRPVTLGEGDWAALLSTELHCVVRVRYGRARHSVVRVERATEGLVVHLSGFFAEAPQDVRDALVRWLRSGKRARASVRTLDAWIDARVRALHAVAPRAVKLVARGKAHDLADVARELGESDLRDEFGPRRAWPTLGWGRAAGSRSRRSLRLGSFDPPTRAVRVHPVLDSAAVPRWFVRYVLFHELLHAVLDVPYDGRGTRRHHGPAFRARERAYADTPRALAWERANIHALIRCARAERPFEAAPAKPPRRAAGGVLRWIQSTLFD